MFILKKIFSPFQYLKIQNKEKRFFDFLLPILFSLIFVNINSHLKHPIHFFSDFTLIHYVNDLLQTLILFSSITLIGLTSLSFSGTHLDSEMKGIPPKLNNQDLTRRLFLIHLFGYLTFSGIVLYFLGGLVQLFSPNIILLANSDYYVYFETLSFFFYLAFLFNILFTVILGLFFLIHRIHSNNL